MAGRATRTATKSTSSSKSNSPNDGANKGGRTTGKGGQQQLDEKMFKRVGFIGEVRDKEDSGSVALGEQARNTEMSEFKERILEEVRKIRKEKVEMEKLKVEIEARAKELEEKVEVLEKKMQDWEAREREWAERQSVMSVMTESSVGDAAVGGAWGSQWSLKSGRSAKSGVSLSGRDVARMKKFVDEQDRKERANNIVIRGIKPDKEDLITWVREFIGFKLGIKAQIESAWKSGPVVVARVGRKEKEEIMKNKKKLVGTDIYIENDLSLDDRKKQEEINRWVKEKRREGWNIRQGTGKVWFKGVWTKWECREEIEIDMEKERKKNNKFCMGTAEAENNDNEVASKDLE